MAIGALNLKNLNPYNSGQNTLNPGFVAGKGSNIFSSEKIDTNDLDGITVGGIVSSNVNAPKDNQNNIFGTPSPLVDGNNGLKSTQRVNPTNSTNPLSPDANTLGNIGSIHYVSPTDEGVKTKELGQKFMAMA